MKTTKHKIQRSGLEAHCKSLGVVGLIQCIQQVDKGHGDYVKERQKWQNGYSVDMRLKAVEQEQ